jgi:hypothetical protein
MPGILSFAKIRSYTLSSQVIVEARQTAKSLAPPPALALVWEPLQPQVEARPLRPTAEPRAPPPVLALVWERLRPRVPAGDR